MIRLLERIEALGVLLPWTLERRDRLLGWDAAGERDISKQFMALAVLNFAAGEYTVL